jgi:GH43 family beta-xylosidase
MTPWATFLRSKRASALDGHAPHVFARYLSAILLASVGFVQTNALIAASATHYTNPIAGSITMGDPFVLMEGRRFFLYGTTAVNEGFKCWSSTNLVDWTERGFAYRKSETSWAGKTFWAPEVFKYQSRYYMIFSAQPSTNSSFSARICLAVSDQPEGPFADLHLPLFDNDWSCIDGHVFIDADGTPFLFFTRVGVLATPAKRYLQGVNYGVKLKVDLSGIDGEPVLCTEADQPWERPAEGRSRCTEGPFVFRRNGVYFMTYSANHYAEPFYGIGWATAPTPLGPWTKSRENPLVTTDLERGVSGPGHNCVIASPDGKELFMVYHSHADPKQPGGRRRVNIDRLIVEDKGHLRFLGPTISPQMLPSGL